MKTSTLAELLALITPAAPEVVTTPGVAGVVTDIPFWKGRGPFELPPAPGCCKWSGTLPSEADGWEKPLKKGLLYGWRPMVVGEIFIRAEDEFFAPRAEEWRKDKKGAEKGPTFVINVKHVRAMRTRRPYLTPRPSDEDEIPFLTIP